MKIPGWREAIRKRDCLATEQLNLIGKSRGDPQYVVSESVQSFSETSRLSGECGNMRLGLRS